jgi:hypothetical protein
MLVDEAKKKLDVLSLEDVQELARGEFQKRDINTLADVCIALMDKEQLSEWAIPAIISEERHHPTKCGRLNEQALKKMFPQFVIENDRVYVPLAQSTVVANEMFEKNSVRLVCEGYSGDDLLMSAFGPIIEDETRMDSKADAAMNIKYFKTLHRALNEMDPQRDWFIDVHWKEPLPNGEWKEFAAYGPLNKQFFEFLEQHWKHWQDKANAYVHLREIHRHSKGNEISW